MLIVTVILFCTFFVYTSTAPQSSLEPIEVIADVKPTTYDMPFSVYDIPPAIPIHEPAVISDDSLDSNLEDFPFHITTDRTVDLAKYANVATDNYDAITELPENDYGINMKDPKFYSKLGYFLSPVMTDSLGNKGDTTYIKENQNAAKEKVDDDKINTTRDEFNPIGDEMNKTNPSVAVIQSSVENKTSNVENKSSSIENNPSKVDNKPSRDENKQSSDEIVNDGARIKHNSFEIDENSVEIKPESGEFKSNKIGFQPKYTNMRGKNAARQFPKTAKRKYRSKCRCEKIWNCPRLQITVPRCPNEYFMCCF